MATTQMVDRRTLLCERLEDRIMLSTVDVIAAGATGAEEIRLQVDGVDVQTWNDLGSGAYSGNYVTRSHSTPNTVTADQIRIQFVNDINRRWILINSAVR